MNSKVFQFSDPAEVEQNTGRFPESERESSGMPSEMPRSRFPESMFF